VPNDTYLKQYVRTVADGGLAIAGSTQPHKAFYELLKSASDTPLPSGTVEMLKLNDKFIRVHKDDPSQKSYSKLSFPKPATPPSLSHWYALELNPPWVRAVVRTLMRFSLKTCHLGKPNAVCRL